MLPHKYVYSESSYALPSLYARVSEEREKSENTEVFFPVRALAADFQGLCLAYAEGIGFMTHE